MRQILPLSQTEMLNVCKFDDFFFSQRIPLSMLMRSSGMSYSYLMPQLLSMYPDYDYLFQRTKKAKQKCDILKKQVASSKDQKSHT